MPRPTSTGPSGGIRRLQGLHCEMTVFRPVPGVVVLTIRGHDVGEFGKAPMREIEQYLREDVRIELFVDAREAAASIDVSGEWAQWLAQHRGSCRGITMLTGSRLIEVTAEFVRGFADLGALMTIVSDPDDFDRRLAAATSSDGGGSASRSIS